MIIVCVTSVDLIELNRITVNKIKTHLFRNFKPLQKCHKLLFYVSLLKINTNIQVNDDDDDDGGGGSNPPFFWECRPCGIAGWLALLTKAGQIQDQHDGGGGLE